MTQQIHNGNGFVRFEELYELLETYENGKIIVTNANAEQQVTYALTDLPYELFTMSHEPNKDDPKYFTTLLEKYDLDPGEVIYFEHAQEAVESAKSVGITSYFYDHEAKDLAALKTFLDTNL